MYQSWLEFDFILVIHCSTHALSVIYSLKYNYIGKMQWCQFSPKKKFVAPSRNPWSWIQGFKGQASGSQFLNQNVKYQQKQSPATEQWYCLRVPVDNMLICDKLTSTSRKIFFMNFRYESQLLTSIASANQFLIYSVHFIFYITISSTANNIKYKISIK